MSMKSEEDLSTLMFTKEDLALKNIAGVCIQLQFPRNCSPSFHLAVSRRVGCKKIRDFCITLEHQESAKPNVWSATVVM